MSAYMAKIKNTFKSRSGSDTGRQQNLPGICVERKVVLCSLSRNKASIDAQSVTSKDVNMAGNAIRKRILKEIPHCRGEYLGANYNLQG